MNLDDNCIFCRIVKGEIPSVVVYENDWVKAILDISPAANGHVVILPKSHGKDILELEDRYVQEVFLAAKKVAIVQKKVLKCDGINILQNNGEAAGQTVFHLHVHVIPRIQNDSITISWTPGMTPENINEIAQELIDNI